MEPCSICVIINHDIFFMFYPWTVLSLCDSFSVGSGLMSDEELREALRELDEREDVRVNGWTANFIEGIVYGAFKSRSLSVKQREKIIQILEQYDKD